MTGEVAVSEVFSLVCELGCARGLRDLAKQPGAGVMRVDEHWTVAVNPHRAPIECEPDGCMKVELPSFEVAVWWNGWLAGLVSAAGGTVCAGELANEDSLCEALRAAVKEADGGD